MRRDRPFATSWSSSTGSSIGYAGVSSKGLLKYLLLTFKCARQRRDASPQGNTLMPVASRSGRRGKT
jgi:hypothetical protein